MAVEILHFNGMSPHIDFADFQKSAEDLFGNPVFSTKIVVFNNFPVAISSHTFIDLIIVIKCENIIDKQIPFELNGRHFRNLIIPIKIANENSFLGISKNDLDFELVEEIFSDDLSNMKTKLPEYFNTRCHLSEARVEPIIYAKFEETVVRQGYLFADKINLKTISACLAKVPYKIYSSYSKWNYGNFDSFLDDIKRIVDNASKDSEYGYLTKKKLDYIARKRKLSDSIFDELGTKTVIIEGKAGTGKTMELINMATRKIENGNNIMFLTYNNLLVNDISKTLKHRQNAHLLNWEKKLKVDGDASNGKTGEAFVSTIHYYIYHLVKSLGVSLIINAERIDVLRENLNKRTAEIYKFLNNNINPAENFNPNNLRTLIHNAPTLTKEVKEQGILLINFLEKNGYTNHYSLKRNVDDFLEDRTKFLLDNFESQAFLSDYHNVLDKTLHIIRNTNDFYDEFDIESKGELLERKFNLDANDVESFSRETFNKKISKRIVSRLRKRTVFVDEAHDCTKIERDILMAIFKPNNFVVTSGGKEQLIRTGEILSWSVASSYNHPSKTFKKENKTFRMKSNVVHLVNFIANKFNVNLNLTPDSVEDSGTLTFDFRTSSDSLIQNIISENLERSRVAGYSPYESLLFLIDSRTDHTIDSSEEEHRILVTENDNISESRGFRRKWTFTEALNMNDNYILWNGTVANKNSLPLPQNLSARMIYYESCRGLEAHSVFCFALDRYFDHKSKDDEASLYLLNDLYATDEHRRNAYAITSVLMALTRAIDTLYINIKDKHSVLGKLLLEYKQQNPEKVNLLTN